MFQPASSSAADAPTEELIIFDQVNHWFQADRPGDAASWAGPADDAWRTAARADEPRVAGTTTSGLPRRQPQEHLVPGGVPAPRQATEHRDPARVATAMAAYARGVAGRRTNLITN